MITGSRRTTLLLAIIGCALGLAIGILLGWIIWPLEYYGCTPAALKPDYIEDYILLIAGQHASDGDVEQARVRLAALGISDADDVVLDLTNRYIAEGRDPAAIRALVGLSYDLGVGTSAMAVYLQTATPTPTPPATATPSATPTPQPSATMTAVPAASTIQTPRPGARATAVSTPSFLLTERRKICVEEAHAGKIQIAVQDAQGQGVPNVQFVISWDGGSESVFTGLKPEHGPGYADRELHDLDLAYAVRIPATGEVVSDLPADPQEAGCPDSSRSVSWQLTFVGNRR